MSLKRKSFSIFGAIFALAIGSLSLAQPVVASPSDVSAVTSPQIVQGPTTPMASPELQAMAAGCGFNFAGQTYNHCTSTGGRVWLSIAWNDSVTLNSYVGEYCVGPGTTTMISLIGPFNWVYVANSKGAAC